MTEPDLPPRRGRPGYDAPTVLRRAIEVFIRQGYEATSMGDLAAELGLTKSAIYHHVPSKEHLLAAALDEALDGLSAAIDTAVGAEGGAPTTGSTTRCEQSVQILAAHLPEVTLLLRVRGNSEVEKAALARRRELDDKLAELVRAAVEEGSLRADIAPELISRLLFGTVNSLVEWYRPDGPVSRRPARRGGRGPGLRGAAERRRCRSGSRSRIPVDRLRLRPRNSAITVSSAARRTVTSYTPERPRTARSVAVATRTSPRRADSRKATSKPEATVIVPRELQATAKALSASGGDQAAVAELPAVDHVLAHGHRHGGGAGPDRHELHAERLARGVAGPHHVGVRRATSSAARAHASKSTVTASETG